MEIQRIIIHELKKESGNNRTSLTFSNDLLPVNNESKELVSALLKSYQGDKIFYAEFDCSPGKYFPEKYQTYKESRRSDDAFIAFTKEVVGNLETLIKTKTLAKGGYVTFVEYEVNGSKFIVIFLIRDTEGKLLKRTQHAFEVKRIEYLDTNHLAMGCRINETKIVADEPNYLSFIRVKQQEVSDYFIDWISAEQLESNTEFTNTLYDIINSIPVPSNPDTNEPYSIDAVRNMVYENASHNAQRNINLKTLSQQLYGDENTIIEYVEQHNISIDTEFRFDKRALKKFIQINVTKDGITLKFSRGDNDIKIKLSEENENMVIIESAPFARALRAQISNDE